MNEALEALSKQLGIPVGKLWPLAVQFAVTDAIVSLVFGVVLASSTIIGARWCWKRLTAWGAADGRNDDEIPKGIIAMVVFGVLVICLYHFFCDISTLVNPEGQLIMRVLRK